MIVRLSGKLVEQEGNLAVIDVAGVGYGVIVYNALSGQLITDQHTDLYIYEHIREQEHSLYGFLSKTDKQLFELLLSVNGIGPKAALALFDVAQPDKLRTEIAGANTVFLTRATGVGKKAAERIVVELQDKVGALVSGSVVSSVDSINSDAIDALLMLGYKKDQALQMLDGIKGASTEDIVKQALKGMK